jgi:arylsulfatase
MFHISLNRRPQKPRRLLLITALVAGPLIGGGVAATAPEVTGVLGSPGATTTIDGKQLPAPDPVFGGKIEQEALQSEAWWAPRIVPPEKAPTSC